jgi:hypothetical protein
VQPNTLVSFDPATKHFSSTPIPSGGGVVRNMVATPEGKLYLACSGVNKVAVAICWLCRCYVNRTVSSL